ncbi:MAG: tetratricopeptide repeat protein [Ideonella sp.]
MRMAEQSRADFVALGDTEGYLRSISNLGILWNRRGDLIGARRLQEEVLILAESLQIPKERCRARINLGHTCQLIGDFARSRQLLTEAQTMAGDGGAPMHAFALLNMSRLDIAENNPEQAAETLQRAQPFIDTGNHFGQIETWLLRGQIATLQGRFADAVGCLSEGLKLAESESSGAPREQVELWQAMSATQAAAGDYQAALKAMHNANEINASLRREGAVLQAATAVQRNAEEQAHLEAQRASASASTGRDTLRELQELRLQLERANEEKDRLTQELARMTR